MNKRFLFGLCCALFLGMGLRPSTTAAKATPPPKQGALTLRVVGVGYERWGNPAPLCADYDDSKPMRRFSIELDITNNTATDMAQPDWFAYGMVGKQLFTTCYTGTAALRGSLPAGKTIRTKFAVFVQPYQSVTALLVGGKGGHNFVCFNEEATGKINWFDCPNKWQATFN